MFLTILWSGFESRTSFFIFQTFFVFDGEGSILNQDLLTWLSVDFYRGGFGFESRNRFSFFVRSFDFYGLDFILGQDLLISSSVIFVLRWCSLFFDWGSNPRLGFYLNLGFHGSGSNLGYNFIFCPLWPFSLLILSRGSGFESRAGFYFFILILASMAWVLFPVRIYFIWSGFELVGLTCSRFLCFFQEGSRR
jgi:hypothetical protein